MKKKKKSLNDIFSELGFEEVVAEEGHNEAKAYADHNDIDISTQQEGEINYCEGKVIYISRAKAEKHKKQRLKRGAAVLCSYKCNNCNGWHLTSRGGK